MNTSSFMDKQIMDLTHSSSQSKDLIDLINQNKHHKHKEDREVQEERVGGDEDALILNGVTKHGHGIVHSYDFQPIRLHSTGAAASSNYDSATDLGAAFFRPWNSESNAGSSHPSPNPIIKSYSSLDTIETAKVVEKERKAFEATILSEIDQTMKKHAENLLHVMEGVNARLTQLESITHRIENSEDDLKVSVGNNLGSTDGKLRQLENILLEVQNGVQTIKDKQNILGAQLQLAKLQVYRMDQPSETQTSVIADPVQQAASAPQQSQQQLPSPINVSLSIPVVPSPNAPPQPPPQQGLPLPVQIPQNPQIPNQFPQNQIPVAPQRDQFFPPPPPQQPVKSQEAPNQLYHLPLTQQLHPQPGAPPHQQYQQTSRPQYSQPAPHLPKQQPPHSPVNLPQLQSSLGHHIEETPYAPSHNNPPNLRQPTSQPSSGSPPSQLYYSAPPRAYEPPSSRPVSGYSSGYSTLSGPIEPYCYDGPSVLKPPQLPTASSVAPSGGSGYPQLPTARVLPQALPTASAASGGSGSAGTGSRVPIDDVVDKVASMGFSRDQVRATVRKLTENGQSVDLNTVLDKLMNEGDVQPFRGWFGAR